MRQQIKRHVGIPVCVGIGASKTLAKLANHVAKKDPRCQGVCDLNTFSPSALDDLLSPLSRRRSVGGGQT